MRFYYLIATSLLVVLSFASTPRDVFAMRLEPESADIVLEDGHAMHDISVQNDGETPATYDVLFQWVRFGSTAEDLRFIPLAESERAWFMAEPNTFTLAPGSIQASRLALSVPSLEANQERVLAVLVRQRTEGTGSVGLQPAAASLLFLKDDLDETQTVQKPLRVVDFSRVTSSAELSAAFTIVLKNEGSITETPQGTVTISDMRGTVVATLPVNIDARRVPAGTLRTLPVIWPYAYKGLRVGDYRAVLDLGSGTAAETKFALWHVPREWYVLPAALGALFLGILMMVIRKKYGGRHA